MLWGGRGERKRERARHNGKGKGLPPFPSSHRPQRAFYFFDYSCFYRDTLREPLRRRELLKYVAFEKRLEKGGKKRRREPGMQGKEDGRFETPCSPQRGVSLTTRRT